MTVVRTVLGDIPPERLGVTDYHEHLFQRSPLLPGEDLDDAAASEQEAAALRGAGADAMVDATPIGLGRNPVQVAAISRRTGLHVVHVTGLHREPHYPVGSEVLAAPVDRLAARLRGELLEDMRSPGCDDGAEGSPVRAGALKAGIGLWSVTPFERRAIAAVGQVAAGTGAPVMVHLEHGSAAHEVLDLLAEDGVAADRVALAHVDRNPDPGLHAELAARGAYLGYDGAARHQRWPDSVLLDCLAAVVAAGYGERLLLGGDVARRSRYVAYGGMPGLAYLLTRFVPRVRAAVGEAATDAVLRGNPARWLAWAPPR
ncbi:phosphotriesterase family protein [Ornithinicoccus halotolerans]|uniref:phosphotriesterase family protein n=1 Tax=Ornithinicoccus halotolerans TaxID=1748220 RepID=UPI0012968293|nr:aryldialkylphosphatase [Ornithinicoccus halotolerans]